ncbi:hybrid sensor histidine kinase/response regulator [Bacteroides cellulosilyticus]|uniref:hybrid sensor histidine kinase/response regulator n=1 Tax=Bacteroides cellulosilyticus TaxID=246787 RepID=UPI0032EE4461
MKRHSTSVIFLRTLIAAGYLLMCLLAVSIMFLWLHEWQELETLEVENRRINAFRQEVHHVYEEMTELSLLGESVLDWDEDDLKHYHTQRMAMDSMLCRFKTMYPAERIDSVRHILEDKERQMRLIVRVLDEQQKLNGKIARQVPVIVQESVQEQPKKPKRKGFLGIFGKKEKPKPTATTTMLRSFNRNMIAERQEQSRRLSAHVDSLATRNAELNRQLQGLIIQIDGKVQADLQKREDEITEMREQSFIQIGSLTGFVLLLLVISYVIIHRNANSIKRYKREMTDLIGQLQQALEQNKVLIASRKKAVHTITHELRTPLTAITGYAGLMEKENDVDKARMYIQNIQYSSNRMREMLNTLLSFFRLNNGKEQPNISSCRILAITHILEVEFMPIAMNNGLILTVESHVDAVILTDKERILQIGNNLLSDAIKFTDNGCVSLTTDYNNGILKLVVEDTGTGMTDEEQRRVFGAFERLSNAVTKDGFGLGLSIVQYIVTMLSGTIRLESEKGKGSRFTVEIPAQVAEELLPQQTARNYTRNSERYHDVIAIDNDEVLLLMLKEMYAQEGVHCDTCTDVAKLMELIRKKEYCLLLTDLNMPDINGFELLELLRTSNVGNSKTIPVVVTTASGSCSKEELMERGFSGCLLKPFSISELMEVSDKCAMKGNRNEKPDFTSLLSYGNEAVMLEKLIAETEKEMQAVMDAEQRKDLQELDALTHHLRSSWEILRADQPLRELHKLLHCEGTSNNEAIHNAVKAVLDKGSEIIRLAKEERRKYNNG